MTNGSDLTKAQENPLNILLVDDNETDVKITLRAFRSAQLKNNVFTVSNGQECLDFVRREGAYQDKEKYPRPDVILLDINMPKVDGFGVLTAIKSDDDYRAIPVVVLTASKNEEDIRKSYSLGASSFIQKPVDYEKFVKMMEGFNFYWCSVVRLPNQK